MSPLRLPYGGSYHELLWSGQPFERLLPARPTTLDSGDAGDDARGGLDVLRQALAAPIGTPPLHELARGRRSAAVLIPGKARRVGTAEYVPLLLEELARAGIPDDAIEIFLADGTHDQHLESDIVDLLGAEVLDRVRCVGHDCHDRGQLVQLGTTSRGTPVWINRRVHTAEVVVLTGRIVPHYFAGFAGGCKAMIPGVAGFDTILANHRLTLDAAGELVPGAAPCALDDNPVHLDLVEAARLAAPDFCLNTLLDTGHRIVAAVAGDPEEAHDAGVRIACETLRVRLEKPVDAAIVSAGGLPYDCNFMQALKAPFNTRAVVRSGGAILWVAECAGGMHPGFLEWARIGSDAALRRAVVRDYTLTGHNSIMLRELLAQHRVALYSALPGESVRALGIHPVSDLAEGLDWLHRVARADFRTAVVPHANVMSAEVAR